MVTVGCKTYRHYFSLFLLKYKLKRVSMFCLRLTALVLSPLVCLTRNSHSGSSCDVRLFRSIAYVDQHPSSLPMNSESLAKEVYFYIKLYFGVHSYQLCSSNGHDPRKST